MENTVFSPELAEKCSLCALKRRTTFHLEQAYDAISYSGSNLSVSIVP
jgi:hypothetical protein